MMNYGAIFITMAEISIYFPPGNFIYTVWGENKEPLYVGWTSNIMAKSFNFDFPFVDITGEYCNLPSWPLEIMVDEKIVELNPRYNSRLHAAMTTIQVLKWFKDFFKRMNLPFTKVVKRRIINELEDCDGLRFRGNIYYTRDDVSNIEEIIREEYGIYDSQS